MRVRKPDIRNLSANEAQFIIDLIRVLMREQDSENGGLVVGARLRDLPTAWFANSLHQERARATAASLVSRRILCLQYGKLFCPGGYDGVVKQQAHVWYTFHPDFFRAGRSDFDGHVRRVADALKPYMFGAAHSETAEDFIVYAMKWLGRELAAEGVAR